MPPAPGCALFADDRSVEAEQRLLGDLTDQGGEVEALDPRGLLELFGGWRLAYAVERVDVVLAVGRLANLQMTATREVGRFARRRTCECSFRSSRSMISPNTQCADVGWYSNRVPGRPS